MSWVSETACNNCLRTREVSNDFSRVLGRSSVVIQTLFRCRSSADQAPVLLSARFFRIEDPGQAWSASSTLTPCRRKGAGGDAMGRRNPATSRPRVGLSARNYKHPGRQHKPGHLARMTATTLSTKPAWSASPAAQVEELGVSGISGVEWDAVSCRQFMGELLLGMGRTPGHDRSRR